jgi:L-alanine-DL-glutamate epimerase-like enolase superfamily enzyme
MSRRAAIELLGIGAAACALGEGGWASAGSSSRIATIDVFPVRYPTGRPAVLVRIADDTGINGWGESVPIPKWSDETLETVTTTIRKYLAPELIGRDPADIQGAHAERRHVHATFPRHQIVQRHVDAGLGNRLSGGERRRNRAVHHRRLRMLDGVAMKPARCGGLLMARRQIDIVNDAGLMWLASGLTDPDVSLAATLALFSSMGQVRPCALNGPQFLAYSVVDQPLVPKDGQLAPPTGAGLGVTVNADKLRAIAAAD